MQDAQDAPKHDVKIRESTKSLFGNSACEDERTQGRTSHAQQTRQGKSSKDLKELL